MTRPSPLPRSLQLIAAATLAACGDGAVAPPEVEPPIATESVRFTGTVVTADGAALPDLEAVGASDVDTVVVAVTPDARFDLTVSRPEGERASVLIREVGAEPGAYLPTLKRFGAEDETTGLIAMLIPSSITLTAGRFAGQTVDLGLQAAIAPENIRVEGGDGTFFALGRWVLGDDIDAPIFGAGTVVDPERSLWTSAWGDARFPLPLYFEHAGTSPEGLVRAPISAEDSTAIWDAIADLEDRFGRDLFEPAVEDEVPVDTLTRVGGPFPERLFAVSLDMAPSLAGPGAINGFAGVDAACRADLPRACERFGEGEVIVGSVTLSAFAGISPEQIRWLVQHELVHALGFGHACFRPSVVAACSGPYAGVSLEAGDPNPLATAYDAAYFEWYRAIHAWTLEHRPHFGIVEALEGERRVRLGKGPIRLAARCLWGEMTDACLDLSPPGIPGS